MNERGGRWFVQARFLNYLLELEHHLGKVTFFAAPFSEDAPERFPSLIPHSIQVQTINVAPTLLGKVAASATHLLNYKRALNQSDLVIHFFPAALDPFVQLLLCARSRVYLTYYKSDWLAWVRLQRVSQIEQRYWWGLERLESKIADISLFRSQAHQQRLAPHCRGATAISQPILSTFASPQTKINHQPKPDSLSLLFVGMIVKEKGLIELIRAVGTLTAEYPALQLHLVGTAPKPPMPPQWLQQEIESANLPNNITIHGFVDDNEKLGAIYSSADIFILPSWSEGFPRVLDEAMSYSLPIVVTRVGGIESILTDNKDAILVPSRDTEALAEGILKVLSNPELRSDLGAAGHHNYKERVHQSAASQHASLLLKQ